MKKILNREQYLDTLKNQRYAKFTGISKSNEALANEINWGDSLVGRLLNSILRKAQIGINLVKIDRVIERLKAEFETLVNLIKVSDDENLRVRLFYLSVSILLGQLIKEIENGKDVKEIINITKGIKNDIGSIAAPDDKTLEDKKDVLAKLDEFIKQLEEMIGGDPKTDEVTTDEPLKLTAGATASALPSTKVDILKLTPAQAVQYLPAYKKALETSKSYLQTFSSKLSGISVKEFDKELSPEESLELKKMYKSCAVFYHPDKISESGLLEKDANSIFNKVAECFKKKDFKTLKEIYDSIDKIKSYKKSVDDYNKFISDLEKKARQKSSVSEEPKKLTSGDPKSKESPSDSGHTDTDKDHEKKQIPQEIDKNEKKVYSYLNFIREEKEDDLKGESDEVQSKIKLVFDKIFTEEYLEKYQVSKDDESKFEDKGERSITIDPIIEIVKIFNRAYKIHTPGIIPSGRRGGKVSNRVFREYEYVGKGEDDARMSEEGGVNPGIGPYRNKVIFNRWENAVLDIIKDPKYQEIFNEKTVFKFGKADVRANKVGTKEGGGKALLSFMNDMLDGSSLYRKGAQSEFISKYFGVTVDDRSLGFGKDVMSNSEVADKVVDDVEELLAFKKMKSGSLKIENYNKGIFKGISVDDKNVWVFKIFKVENKNVFFVMSNGFPYKVKVKDLKTYLSSTGKIYVGSSTWENFQNGIINKKRLLVTDDDTLEPNEEFTSKIKDIQVLYKGDNVFKGEVKGKEDSHNKKFKTIKTKESEIIKQL